MTADPTVYTKLFAFSGALSVLAMASSWWRKDGPKEDEVIVEAANTVLDALSDADTVGRIDRATGRDLRAQLTVEDAIAMNDERELRGFWRRN